jgi:hypothetical protein
VVVVVVFFFFVVVVVAGADRPSPVLPARKRARFRCRRIGESALEAH